jgi:hypothetical protein
MIFCVSPIDENEMMFDPNHPTGRYFNMDSTTIPTPVPTATAVSTTNVTESTSDPPATALVAEDELESIPMLDPSPSSSKDVADLEQSTKNAEKEDDDDDEKVELRLSKEKGGQEHQMFEGKNTVERQPSADIPSQTVMPNIDFLDDDPQPSDELRVMAPTASEVDDLD